MLASGAAFSVVWLLVALLGLACSLAGREDER